MTEYYRAQKNKSYIDKLFEILEDMPGFYKDYIMAISSDVLSVSSKLGYARDVQDFFQYLEDNNPYFKEKGKKNFTISDMELITKTDANEYAASLLSSTKTGKAGYASKTITRKIAAVSSMYMDLQRLDKIAENPFAVVKRPKEKAHHVIYLTESEQKKLIDAARFGKGLTDKQLQYHVPERDVVILSMFLDTGIRVSELVGLNVSDLILDNCSMVVTRKGNKTQELFYSDETKELLEEYLDFREEQLRGLASPALFISFRDAKLGSRLGVKGVENMVKKYAKIAVPLRADKISPHKLRSTFGCTFYANVPDLLLLKDIMGHESVTTTTIYAEAAAIKRKENRNFRQNMKENE